MQQRVVIAMALAKNPALLILDEPTTGLDATVEAEILDLVDKLRQDTRTAVLLISHNLPMVGRMCDRIGVLYAGTLVEEGPASEVLRAARHPYTASLIHCMPASGRRKQDGALATISGQLPSPGQATEACVFAPRCARAEPICRATAPPATRAGTHLAYCHFAPPFPIEAPEAASPHIQAAPGETPLLSVRNLTKTYPTPSGIVRAVTDISFTMHDGEILGLVGESGSGKTTLAKLLLGLVAPDPGGSIALHGAPLAPLLKTRPRRHRQALQIIFQNPDSALNRAHRIRHILSRPLSRLSRLAGPALETRLQSLAAAVRLGQAHLAMRPRALSGGLKQRVAIARAFAGEPKIVICDEPTSALDVSIQAAILNLLAGLQREKNVGYIFISHDLAVIRYLADRIAVLYLGRILEIGPAAAVFSGPHHPYTAALLSAAPSLQGDNPDRIRLTGEIPNPAAIPPGCVFQNRCPQKIGPICETTEPELPFGEIHAIRCHLPQAQMPKAPPL
jgi:peptide/nickel transport system ATP-binding protein